MVGAAFEESWLLRKGEVILIASMEIRHNFIAINRGCKTMFRPIALVAIFLSISLLGNFCHAQGNLLKFSKFALEAKSDLGEAVFSYRLVSSSRSANVGIQLFAKRDDIKESIQYDLIAPVDSTGSPIILNLFRAQENRGSFRMPIPKGIYSGFKLILFEAPNGKTLDYSKLLYDSSIDPPNPPISIKLKIVTTQRRVVSPTLDISSKKIVVKPNADNTADVTISALVKIPKAMGKQGAGYWAMAKGTAGFSQVWLPLASAVPGADALDDYLKIPVSFEIKAVEKGLTSLDLGLFPDKMEKAIKWIINAVDIEIGGDQWVVKAPPNLMPPRVRVSNRSFHLTNGKPFDFYADNLAGKKGVGFVRGGNYGNAVTWTLYPALNSPNYFTLLGEMGCKYLRFSLNPNRYLAEPLYQHVIDQIIQNIWAASIYPIVTPQDLPDAPTLAERVEKGKRLLEMLATKYKGKSVWLEVCNEPHEFTVWKDWKPVAIRYVKTIRAIDPDAFVIVPFEDFSKDGRGAAKDPITEAAVDLYDGHAYLKPEEVAQNFKPPILAGLPVLIGEYGGGGYEYLSQMDMAMQSLPPGLVAAGPWAFTIPGQDSLALVQDGSTASLKMTPSGQAVFDDYALWNAGKRKH